MKAKAKTPAADELVPTTTKIPASLQLRLKQWAAHEDRSASWVVIEALTEYLDAKEARQAYIDDANAAWDHYVLTGEHKTAAQMRSVVADIKARARKRRT